MPPGIRTPSNADDAHTLMFIRAGLGPLPNTLLFNQSEERIYAESIYSP